jgi:membrane associated rhomboid family serine protease
MLPFHDTEPNRYSFFPFMTFVIIAVNIGIHLIVTFTVYGDFWAFLMIYGYTPTLIVGAHGPGVLSNFTSIFLHSGWFHLLGNMLPLWVFGRRVEDACGSWRFLAFYLLAGTWANILFTLVQHDSPIPGIGASGAIFGVMGAYLLLYPMGRIRTFITFIPFVPMWPRIRAIWVVLYFVGVQIIPALQILLRQADYSVNHWAHLGGFFSSVFILLFVRPEAYARYVSDTLV